MASVSTVRDNVARTIAGKQALLVAMRTQADSAHGVTRTVLTTFIGFLELNPDTAFCDSVFTIVQNPGGHCK